MRFGRFLLLLTIAVVGTDPEVLLLLEASSGGWRYALARMNRDAVTVSFRGKPVESFPHLDDGQLLDAEQAYSVYVAPALAGAN